MTITAEGVVAEKPAVTRWPWLDRPRVWNATVALLIVALTVAVVARYRRANHDVAYFIQCAQMLLEGRTPYVGYVDVNPPLIVYLNVPAVFLAQVAHLPPALTFHLFVIGLVIAGTLLLSRALAELVPAPTPVERGMLLTLWAAISVWVWLRNDLGQREHLFVLTYFPFLVLRVARFQTGAQRVSTALAVVMGVLAGLGACLKPFFLLPVVVAEGVLWLWSRRTRAWLAPEMIALVVVGFVYAAHFALWPASMRDAFFHRWVPLLRRTYAVYDMPWPAMRSGIINQSTIAIPVLVALFGLWLSSRAGGAFRMLLSAFSAVTLAALVDYIIQRKGWPYHLVPLTAGAVMTAGVMAVQCVRAPAWGRLAFRGDLALAAWLVAPFAAAVCLVHAVHRTPPDPFAKTIETYSRPGDRVLVVSTSVAPAYPLLVIDNRQQASRYLCCFPIALFYYGEHWPAGHPAYHDRATATPDERQFLSDLEQDVVTEKPTLVLVQADQCQGCSPDFNVEDYLRHEGTIQRVIDPSYRELPGVLAGWHVYVPASRDVQRAADLHGSGNWSIFARGG